MEGRYDVEVCDECGREVSDSEHATSHHQNGPTHWVPVVPCDDAAIERVAQKIVERALGGFDDEDGAAWAALKEAEREEWREEARDLLAAAGETP